MQLHSISLITLFKYKDGINHWYIDARICTTDMEYDNHWYIDVRICTIDIWNMTISGTLMLEFVPLTYGICKSVVH